jgi:hypothetical protein
MKYINKEGFCWYLTEDFSLGVHLAMILSGRDPKAFFIKLISEYDQNRLEYAQRAVI